MHDEPAADDDDETLVAEFTAGRSSGLARVYAAYRKPLYSTAYGVLRDENDAQDCVHDTLLRLWQRSGAFRSERGSLRSYLMVSVRNEALTRKRNASRHLRIEQRAAQERAPAYDLEPSDPIERARLHAALATLPQEQQRALTLAYFGHLTHVEVAERLAAPLGTVKSRIALALRKLHTALADGRRDR